MVLLSGRPLAILVSVCVITALFAPRASAREDDPLAFPFDRKYGQAEVGGPYAGVEFHMSRPLPARISFYAPVANSIDLSTDYWKRDESDPIRIGIRVNGGPHRDITRESWRYVVSPHTITFDHQTDSLSLRLRYEFGRQLPSAVMTLLARNVCRDTLSLDVDIRYHVILRPCQSYGRVEPNRTRFREGHNAVVYDFDDPRTARASVVIQNVGFGAVNSTADGFQFRLRLAPGDSISIPQVISSCRQHESDALIRRVAVGWRSDVDSYNTFVRSYAATTATIHTGDAWIDRSVLWANGILASNAHNLEGVVVPMPCPAEYNFFFTHDVLMTDLAADNFDLPRVKRDLRYIAAQAQGNIIPHAYYWKDDGYKTELCTPDNWNHLWFILACGRYLRHSDDTATVTALLPLMRKSIDEILTQCGPDSLMHAFRPDWWDFGRREGPRAYITILTIRALRDAMFVGARLGRFDFPLKSWEALADGMQRALVSTLWDEPNGYLTNYNGTDKDSHYYMGSILASSFGMLDDVKSHRLLETAARYLVEPSLGVRTVMPPDFHTDSVKAYFKIVDNEAGNPYLYANGGIWPHCNAWYATALNQSGEGKRAFDFVKTTMTLDGIANSPMGQPAMYEYRYSDPHSPEFGKIDKPSFLWAGGFYLFTLYNLLGVDDGAWNVSLGGSTADQVSGAHFSLEYHGRLDITLEGAGKPVSNVTVNGNAVSSPILPGGTCSGGTWRVARGECRSPIIEQVNAIFYASQWEPLRKKLHCRVSSFDGHRTVVEIRSRTPVQSATVDGKKLRPIATVRADGGSVLTTLAFSGRHSMQNLLVTF